MVTRRDPTTHELFPSYSVPFGKREDRRIPAGQVVGAMSIQRKMRAGVWRLLPGLPVSQRCCRDLPQSRQWYAGLFTKERQFVSQWSSMNDEVDWTHIVVWKLG